MSDQSQALFMTYVILVVENRYFYMLENMAGVDSNSNSNSMTYHVYLNSGERSRYYLKTKTRKIFYTIFLKYDKLVRCRKISYIDNSNSMTYHVHLNSGERSRHYLKTKTRKFFYTIFLKYDKLLRCRKISYIEF